MKISVKKNRKPPIYGWFSNGAYFLSAFSALTTGRPSNMYGSKEEVEDEAAARGREIVWEDVSG